jgi:hypothetical protein
MVLMLLAGTEVFGQYGFDVSKDKENGQVVYKGMITFADLKEQLSFSWLEKGANEYKPDTNQLKFLKANLPNYNITVFMGTWCDDSQNLIPKLYKVLQLTNYPMTKYMMYGIDRAKRSKDDEQKLYNIDKVPTVILYRNNREAGRITEFVQKSIEKDLKAIIEADMERRR